MKTLKERLNEIKKEAVDKILKKNYTHSGLEISGDRHYGITLKIDGCDFKIGVPGSLEYLVFFDCDFCLDIGSEKKIAKLLYERHIDEFKKREIEKKINDLKKQLE